ncbi:MAG: hypothetical protein KKF48_04520 [Nanoarchaeota archaeon]|nr:hypothetical protein [Nanoarchaeota archaeon]MBU1028280.1 hypothetical protein [Nanoarchaeota archaeon]
MNVDLHNHLGPNGTNPGFDETIDIAYSRLGDGGIFGICNDGPDDSRYEKFVNQKPEKYERIFTDDFKKYVYVPQKRISIVKVEEVEPREGHFLAVGMPSIKRIWKNKNPPSLEDALKSAEDFDAIKIIVHPFSRDGLGEYLNENFPLLEEFDAWEVYNASAELLIPGLLPKNANKKAQDYYKNFIDQNTPLGSFSSIGACAFTDGHSAEVIGTSYTKIKDNGGLFLLMLKSGIKQNKNFDNLYMQPAKKDALKHCYHMAKQIAFKILA